VKRGGGKCDPASHLDAIARSSKKHCGVIWDWNTAQGRVHRKQQRGRLDADQSGSGRECPDLCAPLVRRSTSFVAQALGYPKLRNLISPNDAEAFVDVLRRAATVAVDPPTERRSRDPGDDYLVAIAAANSAYLVTGPTK
jgi:hypothetical protein